MIEENDRQFYDLLRNWHWGEVGDLIVSDPANPITLSDLTLSDLHRQFSIEGANLALQEVFNEFKNGGCSLGLDAQDGHLFVVVTLFEGQMEFTKVLDDPFSDIALNDPEMARDIARVFRKLAKQLDQAAKRDEVV